MPTESPLLTIAVPTYNRVSSLEILLRHLAPQIEDAPEIELIVCDNASTDGTPQLVERLAATKVVDRYLRSEANLGMDGNFLRCFENARGKYLWLVGDDDIVVPGALARVMEILRESSPDLLFFRHSVFDDTFLPKPDDLQERSTPKVYHDAKEFLHAVNRRGDFAFLSTLVVNRDRAKAELQIPLRELEGSLLTQLGWVYSLLADLQSGIILEERLVAGRGGNSGGYGAAKIFGVNWHQLAMRVLHRRPDILRAVVDDHLSTWFPAHWVAIRRSSTQFHIEEAESMLRSCYGNDLKYWTHVWPLVKAPVGIAAAYARLLRALNRLL